MAPISLISLLKVRKKENKTYKAGGKQHQSWFSESLYPLLPSRPQSTNNVFPCVYSSFCQQYTSCKYNVPYKTFIVIRPTRNGSIIDINGNLFIMTITDILRGRVQGDSNSYNLYSLQTHIS